MLLTEPQAPHWDRPFKRLSVADEALAKRIMADVGIVRTMRAAWLSTLTSGTERSFWIFERSDGRVYTGKVWIGSAKSENLRQWGELRGLPTRPIAIIIRTQAPGNVRYFPATKIER